MSDLPRKIDIQEEGPREGFQFEKGPISTSRKIELIDSLSDTGLLEIQVGSYVNPKRVPGWADVEDVVAGIHRKPDVRYTVLWLNERGLQRALAAEGVFLKGMQAPEILANTWPLALIALATLTTSALLFRLRME